MRIFVLIAAGSALLCPQLAAAQQEGRQRNPQQIAEQVLATSGSGTRWGMVVVDDQGREVVSIDPEGRYIPASNTKLFTTAAAFWRISRCAS